MGDTGKRRLPCLRVSLSPCPFSLSLFMCRVLAATSTKLSELKPVWRGFLILCRHIVAAFAVAALEHDIVAWHLLISNCQLPIADWKSCNPLALPIVNWQSTIGNV